MDWIWLIGCLLISYLLGSIPFGFLTALLVSGVDIRTQGSGNIGATNVGRVIGWKWFFVVLVFDFLKGFGPALVVPWLLNPEQLPGLSAATIAVMAGVSAMAGHLWPIYLHFRGGKGVGTGLGVVVALSVYSSWWPVAAAVLTFIILVALTRYISLASIVGAFVYGGLQLALMDDLFQAENWGIVLLCLFGPVLVLWRHRQNVVRLWEGTESKIGKKTSNPASAG
ncbi:Acyl-phosphate:glycerol-3-phosphate O-acyltransferase PlsY [Planctomycetales bacterium 10988]|nr:Acyl-phosphate:glycerol-3-phosphate O-acyltransferase PlsY [Planctomycetales bacterium 10988]